MSDYPNYQSDPNFLRTTTEETYVDSKLKSITYYHYRCEFCDSKYMSENQNGARCISCNKHICSDCLEAEWCKNDWLKIKIPLQKRILAAKKNINRKNEWIFGVVAFLLVLATFYTAELANEQEGVYVFA